MTRPATPEHAVVVTRAINQAMREIADLRRQWAKEDQKRKQKEASA